MQSANHAYSPGRNQRLKTADLQTLTVPESKRSALTDSLELIEEQFYSADGEQYNTFYQYSNSPCET